MPVFYIKPLNEDAEKYYASHSTFNPGDCGIDLFTTRDVTIKAYETVFIGLGIQVECQDEMREGENISYYMYPRSSISKTPLRLANSVGIIDSGYRGEIIAAFDNTSKDTYTVRAGTRLVQLCTPTLSNKITCKMVSELSSSDRGTRGIGSTGK